jgi:hypothetical protein
VPVKLWGALLRTELAYEAQHGRVERAHGAYYYLSYIGTRAESRGKGYASLLMKQVRSAQPWAGSGRCRAPRACTRPAPRRPTRALPTCTPPARCR